MTYNDFNRALIEDFRANRGKISSGPFANGPILLLTAKGARSGEERTMPLAYTRDGDRYVVLASKGGAPTNPGWYHNLRAHARVTVEVGPEKFQAQATVVSGEERERLFERHAQRMPGFRDYQRRTARQIPVIILERLPD
jgi:deazaflavin-dependent oxidoreductase (nitroreductase family)